MQDKLLAIAGKEFKSRLILGTGKYKSLSLMRECLEAAAPAMVTVAVRRVDLADRSEGAFSTFIPKDTPLLANTAGCYTAEEAIRAARLGREILDSSWVKLEVLGDPKTLLPDTAALLEATRVLARDGFIVLPYTNDDPIVAKRLEEAGAAAIMPLAAPIGSGQGILNDLNLRFIQDQAKVPIIVDAGVGTASDACIAMELGVDGILMNTAVAEAQDPVAMARAMKLAIEAGRLAFLAGRMPKRYGGSPSSPVQGTLVSQP